mmetsp:Transcript_3633/g.10601  ORF Transcript_3633/g.10601 Transcript_3633/m.10601 type:complete len:262 (-) Transcript_3633:1440-2225(-)
MRTDFVLDGFLDLGDRLPRFLNRIPVLHGDICGVHVVVAPMQVCDFAVLLPAHGVEAEPLQVQDVHEAQEDPTHLEAPSHPPQGLPWQAFDLRWQARPTSRRSPVSVAPRGAILALVRGVGVGIFIALGLAQDRLDDDLRFPDELRDHPQRQDVPALNVVVDTTLGLQIVEHLPALVVERAHEGVIEGFALLLLRGQVSPCTIAVLLQPCVVMVVQAALPLRLHHVAGHRLAPDLEVLPVLLQGFHLRLRHQPRRASLPAP